MNFSGIQDVSEGKVAGRLHRPVAESTGGLVLTHGASGNADGPLLVAVAEGLALAGLFVLRYELPYRQRRRSGPPSPSGAVEDREGLRAAAEWMKQMQDGPVYLGGQSYGGRQVSMLAAEEADLARMLLLMSYPLHPPGKPGLLRTAHFAKLKTPALFIHGRKDPFGSEEEMRAALEAIAARHDLRMIDGAGHDLGRDKKSAGREIAAAFLEARTELI